MGVQETHTDRETGNDKLDELKGWTIWSALAENYMEKKKTEAAILMSKKT